MSNRYNLSNLEASFKQYLLAGNTNALTAKNYLSDFRHFMGWLAFTMKSRGISLDITGPVSFIDEALVSEYKTYLSLNKIPRQTINRRLSTLRKFCTFCISQGWMKENPAKKISNIKYQKSKIKTSEVNGRNGETSEVNKLLAEFKTDLEKEDYDPLTIKSYLDDVQEMLQI